MKAGLLIALWLAAAPASTLDGARSGYAQAEAALQSAHAQVAQQQAQLDALSADIARAKAQQSGQPALFVPGELEKKLAESQSLAQSLERSRADERARADAAEQSRAKLYDALSGEIAAREKGASDPAALAELQKLQAERAQVAPSAGGAVAAPSFSKPSDDPRELRERADALHDQADKLSKQEAALQQRIQAAREQAQLDRQLRRLSGDDALFDESDRRVRISRTDQAGNAAGGDRTLGTTPVAGSSTKTTSATDTATTTGGGGVGGTTNQNPGASFSGPSASVTADSPSPSVSASAQEVPNPVTRTGELVRPDELGHGGALADDGEDSVGALLAAQKKLAAERARLESQAKALEAQAAGK